MNQQANVNQIAGRYNENRYAQNAENLRRGYTEVRQGIRDLLKKHETL